VLLSDEADERFVAHLPEVTILVSSGVALDGHDLTL
jgi:hypothetical protein